MPEPDGPDTVPNPEPPAAPATPVEPALKLEANLDLTMASELAKTLLALRGAALTIDASFVQHIGGQCGQVLVSAMNTWRADQIPLAIVDGSAEFVEGIRLLGLRSAFEPEDARS